MNSRRTSVTHPLRVDWIRPEDVPQFAGRLGLTFAPGKWQPEGHTAFWDRDLEADLTRLRDAWTTDCLVTLNEGHELERLRIPTLCERAVAAGIESLYFPIPDQGIPSDPGAFAELCAQITERLADGRRVVVHCMGGLGRSGLVAAACIIGLGYSSEQAIALVRNARPGAVENTAQERFLAGVAPA
ncbi:MAG: dual specificity protein phosphatase family protein [Bradymonadaceae bacterium]|nr:dual specificity protein phosphatase family protein [Lujinxingiaceae bacterium]